MSDFKKVVVKDCPPSRNLYKVSGSGNKFYVYKVSVGFISDSLDEVGTSTNLRDALDLVKADSGGNRLDISDW